MSLLDEFEEPEPVNALDYFEAFGLTRLEAFNLVLHLMLTRTYVLPADAREVAAELGFNLPYVHPDNGRMH